MSRLAAHMILEVRRIVISIDTAELDRICFICILKESSKSMFHEPRAAYGLTVRRRIPYLRAYPSAASLRSESKHDPGREPEIVYGLAAEPVSAGVQIIRLESRTANRSFTLTSRPPPTAHA